MPGDEYHVRAAFGDACRNGADADFGDEFDGDPGFRIGVAEVEDEFREVFDGVDVVMGRRGDEETPGVA